MRTTVNLDDVALQSAKEFAKSRSIPLGQAVSVLIRRGLTVACPTRKVNGLLVFDPPPDEPAVSSDTVRRLEDEP